MSNEIVFQSSAFWSMVGFLFPGRLLLTWEPGAAPDLLLNWERGIDYRRRGKSFGVAFSELTGGMEWKRESVIASEVTALDKSEKCTYSMVTALISGHKQAAFFVVVVFVVVACFVFLPQCTKCLCCCCLFGV